MNKILNYKTPSTPKIINITDDVKSVVQKSKVKEGLCHVFVKSTTSAIIIMEDEEGIKKDLMEALEKIAPLDKNYHHDTAWGDDNGFSHLRAEFLGQSSVIPVNKSSLSLGTWQNIFLIDFDNKEREREVVITIN